jgi:hypothetical protein
MLSKKMLQRKVRIRTLDWNSKKSALESMLFVRRSRMGSSMRRKNEFKTLGKVDDALYILHDVSGHCDDDCLFFGKFYVDKRTSVSVRCAAMQLHARLDCESMYHVIPGVLDQRDFVLVLFSNGDDFVVEFVRCALAFVLLRYVQVQEKV